MKCSQLVSCAFPDYWAPAAHHVLFLSWTMSFNPVMEAHCVPVKNIPDMFICNLKNKKFELMLMRCVKAYSMPLLICNHFHEWLANIGKIATFIGDTVLLCRHVQISLNVENRDFDGWNLRPVLKIPYTACPCLSQLVSAQFALKMCLAARNHQKIYKTPYFSIQGHPRSLNSAPIESQCTTFY